MGSNVRITFAIPTLRNCCFFFLKKKILSFKAFSLLQSQSSTDTHTDADLT